VRDANWGTVEPRLENLRIDAIGSTYDVAFDAFCQRDEIDFRWHGHISGETNQITFRFEGEAHSDFNSNRIGFCLLHPMDAAGRRCEIVHVDGDREQSTFPIPIAPHQPWTDIRAMKHEAAPEVWGSVQFEGDAWETEDQRNWTDASFKTYCTPLRLPFPRHIKRGDRIVQTVVLKLESIHTLKETSAEQAVSIKIDPQNTGDVPQIGLGWPEAGQTLTSNQRERLRALHLSHLRFDWHAAKTQPQQLATALREAAALDLPLEMALFVEDEQSLDELAQQLRAVQQQVRVARWLIFDAQSKLTTPELVTSARKVLGGIDSVAQFAGGTDANFAELNRNRPAIPELDALTFAINPQVHTFDEASLVETNQAQAVVLQSARQFADGLPLGVSAVTLKPRFNAVATQEETANAEGLPSQVDVRQLSLFGAGWTLGSLKYMVQGGASSVTYFQTVGWRGVMESETGSPRPALFPSLPDAVFPLYFVLATVGEFAGGMVMNAVSDKPQNVESLTLRKAGRMQVLLASYVNEAQRLQLQNLPSQVRVKFLDENNVENALRQPQFFLLENGEAREVGNGSLEIELPPYALAWVEWNE
jgi:hypothetical protein